ncbi:MAG: hypothetical protein JOZ73_05275 [Solirubrobacterales bacterium]|nr:hypothetical protein [Solirubrobacterales bacterium]
MRSATTRLLGASAVIALLVVGSSYAAATLHYGGKTSQKQRVTFTISGGSVKRLKFRIVDNCRRHRHLDVNDSGFPTLPIKHGTFGGTFTAKAPSVAKVSVSGHVYGRSVVGTLKDRTKSHKWHRFCSGKATFKLRAL